MKKYKFLDLKYVNESFEEELKEAACNVISSGRYILGENVTLLEKDIAEICQTRYAIAVSNGLDALRLILRAYIEMGEFKEGDEVIVAANTYVATVLAISDNNLIPVFAEPSPETMNLDLHNIEQYITDRTCAVMPVHLYGSTCWDETLLKLPGLYNLKVIEDNAQAIGACSHVPGLFNTHATGGLGHAGALSFYPTKNLGSLGDAGAVVTNDGKLAETVYALRNYGSDYRYHNVYRGWNCRMDEIQAAILRVKIPYLQKENIRRNKLARIYNEKILNTSIKKPIVSEHQASQVWHQYVIRSPYRDRLRKYLSENGVETDVSYPTPPHLQPCYKTYKNKKLPITQSICNEVVSLPISSLTTENDAVEISEIINRFKY